MVNTLAKLGVFRAQQHSSHGLLLLDFQHQQCDVWPEYQEHEVLDIANNGTVLALSRSCVVRGRDKKEVSVISRSDQSTVFSTQQYYVYDAKFDATAQKLLLVTQGKKPFCLDLLSGHIIGEMPAAIRVFKGDAHLPTNTFYAPSEQKKNTLHKLNFDTGTTTESTVSVDAIITRLRFSRDQQYLYCTTQRNILYCFDAQLNLRWQTDFHHLGQKGGTICTATIVLSEDNRLLCLPVSATEQNSWGEDYVVDTASGELQRRLQGYQYRGRIASDFFGTEVLLHGGHTLNLESGEVSLRPIW